MAYFVETAERLGLPLLYLQDVSGFMVGAEAESEGIIRAGAEMVESMACATVPKIVLTLNHASGAGYYAMAGQGFDPTFTFAWPTARIGVMEGDAAVQAVHGPELARLKAAGEPVPERLAASIAQTRADYERWLDARYAAARGHVDAILDPLGNPSDSGICLRGRHGLRTSRTSDDGNVVSLRALIYGLSRTAACAASPWPRPKGAIFWIHALAETLLLEMAEAAEDSETGAILIEADGPMFCGGLDPASPPSPDLFSIGRRAAKAHRRCGKGRGRVGGAGVDRQRARRHRRAGLHFWPDRYSRRPLV